MNNIDQQELENFLVHALDEDVKDGDHTSLACVPYSAIGNAKLLVKADGILAGIAIAERIFFHVDPTLKFKKILDDGTAAVNGMIAFEVEGKSQSILKAERLVLNTMQRMSGIATMAAQFVKAVEGYDVQILDTRKTTPMLRFLEKLAVRIGGATNYRTGLYDRIMIKDNHIDFCGSITKAVEKTIAYLESKQLDLEITVEVRNLKELELER